MLTKVTIKKNYLKNGTISLHLAYYPPFYDAREHKIIRTENLHLSLIAKPKTAIEKKHNADMEDLALAIQSKRLIQIRNEEFDFLDKTKGSEDFLAYFEKECRTHHTKWMGCYKHFYDFCHGQCTFGMLNVAMCKGFSEYLLHDVKNKRTGTPIHQNSAAGYLTSFRTLLKKAYVEKMLDTNLNDYFDPIPTLPTQKEFLTWEECQRILATPCKNDVLKRATMFAIFTGLRISDILSLEWDHIKKAPNGKWCIYKEVQKTRKWKPFPLTEEALVFCGERSYGYVFKGLKRTMTFDPFKKLIADAGITKHISFHCLRHTFASMLHAKHIDIYTIKTLLGHSQVTTTQIYTDVSDDTMWDAVEKISFQQPPKQ